MIKLCTLFFGALVVLGSHQQLVRGQQEQSLVFNEGPVVLTGRINNGAGQKVSLTILEVCGKVNHSATLDEDGRFRFSFDMLSPHDNWLRFGTDTVQIFLAPNDQIQLEADGDNFLETVTYSGDHAGFNHCLLLFHREFTDAFESQNYLRNKRELAPDKFNQFTLNLVRLMSEKIDAIAQKEQPGQQAIAWMNNSLKYDRLENLLEYGERHQQALPADFYKLLDDSELPDEYAMQCSQYYDDYMRKHHIDYQLLQIDGARDAIKQLNEGTYEGLDSFFDFVDANVSNELAKTIFLTNICYRFVEADHEAVELIFAKYAKIVNNSTFQNFILRRIDEIKADQPTVKTLDDLAGLDHVGDIFEEIKQNSPGKVLYIDVWGTWCGSCINYFPHSKKLQESLNSQDIEFVHLCVKSPQEDWEKMIRQFDLQGTQYLLNDAQTTVLQESIKSHGVPRYIIIDRDGAIVDTHAKIPSSNALEDELRELTNRATSAR